jgi:hypothetical protein
MQTAVRGGFLTPFSHPSLVKPTSDARGIDASFQGFDGSSRQKGVEIAGWTGQRDRGWRSRCDSATLNLPRVGRYQVHCPTLCTIRLRLGRSFLSFFRPFRAHGDGWGSTIKPQDAFREDPVTRARALSSALTKSATEREETRPLRESCGADRYLDTLSLATLSLRLSPAVP